MRLKELKALAEEMRLVRVSNISRTLATSDFIGTKLILHPEELIKLITALEEAHSIMRSTQQYNNPYQWLDKYKELFE